MSDVPMPNTCHPSLEHLADFVRSSRENYALRYMVQPRPLIATMRALDDPNPTTEAVSDVRTLTKRKVAGPAPFVGRPFSYVWWAWTTDDGTGRSITTDSELAYTMSEGEWLTRRRVT